MKEDLIATSVPQMVLERVRKEEGELFYINSKYGNLIWVFCNAKRKNSYEILACGDMDIISYIKKSSYNIYTISKLCKELNLFISQMQVAELTIGSAVFFQSLNTEDLYAVCMVN